MAVAVFAAASTLAADEVPPPPPVPAAGSVSAAPAASATPAMAASLSLDDAVQRALAKNYTIKVRSFSVPIAQSAVTEAYGHYDPRLQFSYTKARNNQPQGTNSQTGQNLPPTIYDNSTYNGKIEGELPLGLGYQLSASTNNSAGTFASSFGSDYSYWGSFAGIGAQLPLLRGFGGATTLTAIRIAKTDRSISEWDFRATVINTITDVIYAYDELLFAHANLRSANRLKENASGLYRENQQRFRVGDMSDYDVLSAQARVATREEGILLAERFVHDSENRLKQLISDDTSAALLDAPLTLPALDTPVEVTVQAAADIPLALQNRPDYQQARLAVERNDYNFRLYRNQLLPAVDLTGSYGYAGVGTDFSSSRSQLRSNAFPSYSAGVTISLPLTSTGERARYRSARLARERAETSLQQLEQDIVVRVGNAAGQIETTWKRVLATRASRELSERTLAAEVKRLRAGPGSTFVVLQLQEILASDEVREARAIADYHNALAEYDRQLSRTLVTRHVDLAVAPAEAVH